MPRDTDGSLMTEKQEKDKYFKENLALYKSLTLKEAGATGPKSGRGTSFGVGRWQDFIDELERIAITTKEQEDIDRLNLFLQEQQRKQEESQLEGEIEGAEATREMMEEDAELNEERMKIMPPDLYWDEDATDAEIAADVKAYEEGGPYLDEGTKLDATWTDDDGVVRSDFENFHNRGLKGNRDKDGNLITAKSDMAKEIETDEKIEAEIEKDFTGGDELDTTVAGWITQFKALSEEDFRDIDRQDLVPLGRNAVDAYFEVLDIHDAGDEREEASLANEFDWQGKAKGPLTDEERDNLVQEDVAREDAKFDDQLEDAESDRTMMEADADADKLDADYEASEFPMMGMSDEDKGMFSFQKTDTIANKKQQDSINTIVGDTGMNEEQARQLMTKLKGICG